jgi:hypothetical protein
MNDSTAHGYVECQLAETVSRVSRRVGWSSPEGVHDEVEFGASPARNLGHQLPHRVRVLRRRPGRLAARAQPSVATGESVIECPSPLNVLKYTYDHLAVIEHAQINISI